MAGKPNQVAPVKPVPTFAEYLSGFFWFLRPDEEASSCTRCDEQQAMARHERQQRQEAEQRADDARRHAQHARQRADGLDRKATQFEGKLAEAEAKLKLAADEHTATVAALTGTIGRLSKEIEDATASIFRVQQEPYPAERRESSQQPEWEPPNILACRPTAGRFASVMAGTRWYRLLVLMLLGVVLGWPLLGSAPSVAGASVHLAGPVPDGCDDCNGCESSPGSEQTCPTTMCPVVQAVVPTLDLDWPRTRAWLLAASDEQGRDHIPGTQAPPPRAIHLA